MVQPLILTLGLDIASMVILTSLRTRYFPRTRNLLNAHLTLFHSLPSTSQAPIERILSNVVSREDHFMVEIREPFLLVNKYNSVNKGGIKRGRGVGISIVSQQVRNLHRELVGEFMKEGLELTAQDQAEINPHITVQKGVDNDEAYKTLEELREKFEDREGVAERLVLWRYETGGEWTRLKEFEFSGNDQ